jgi:hypothetical protein
MSCHRLLHDNQFDRIKNLLPRKVHDRGVTARDYRQFVEAELWIAHASSQWRDFLRPSSLLVRLKQAIVEARPCIRK